MIAASRLTPEGVAQSAPTLASGVLGAVICRNGKGGHRLTTVPPMPSQQAAPLSAGCGSVSPLRAPPERLAYVAAFDPAGKVKDAMTVTGGGHTAEMTRGAGG